MHPTSKETVIEVLEIAECNLLYSFKGLRPDEIYSQVNPELNHIAWIFGHCAVHLHWIVDLEYQKKRTYSEEVCHYYRYGTTKDEILSDTPPINFYDLVEKYLEISQSSFAYLNSVDDEAIYVDFPVEPKESLYQTLNTVALHYMGHMGQIVMIRRALGNPGPSFVDGVTKSRRDVVMKEWNEWWAQERNAFKI